MQLQTGEAELIVCFYVPEAAENFIKGLFLNQQLQIADHKSKTTFQITQVESLGEGLRESGIEGVKLEKVVLPPLSPLVVGRKNERVIMIIVHHRTKTLKIAFCITGQVMQMKLHYYA